jgi:aminoglycoside phosphotransferase (APT) family kinase protein
MASSIALVARELGRVGVDRVLPAGGTLPDTGAALTPAFLEMITGQPTGSIRSVSVLGEDHGTAGRVRVRLTTSSASDLPETLFVKVTPRNVIQRVMMNVFELGAREVLFYGAIAPQVPVRVPRCHGVELDARRGRNVIVLEDLTDTATFRDIRSPASADEAAAVVEALADLHAAFWNSPRFGRDLAPLRARSAASERLGNRFVGRILGNLKGHAAEVVPEEIQRKSRVVLERRAEVDRHWRTLPQTLCHGDTHFGNLFFEGPRPGFLDWQAVMMGPGIRDVSYFLIASVDADELPSIERDLVERYVERLGSHGVDVDRALAWDRYRASAVEIYVAAIVTASTSDRMQPAEISVVGVDRVAAAVQRLETFDVLERALTTGF